MDKAKSLFNIREGGMKMLGGGALKFCRGL